MECAICQKKFETRVQLTSHIQGSHKNYDSKKYYDEFLKTQEDEGICPVCHKETNFNGLNKGYNKYCSPTCAWHDPNMILKRRKTISKKTPEEIELWKKRNKEARFNNGKYISDKEFNNRIKRSENGFKEYLKRANCELISYNFNDKKTVTFICNKCHNITTYGRALLDKMNREKDYTICHFCNNHRSVSSPEKDLKKFLMELNVGQCILNDRKLLEGKELDILLTDKKIAIEMNGLYWHNEKCVEKNYHLQKTEECEQKGIQLIHIFDDEWINKKEIVKSRLKGILGLNERIYARKCECREITFEESKNFLDENHIQGNCCSKFHYGLYNNGELVSVMTFGESRFKKGEFELLRFANKLYTNVVGGASKLLKHFLREHSGVKEIVSYADRRWSKGNLYEKIGFSLKGKTPPSYFYLVNHKRHSRIEFQKHKLVEKGYNPLKTEHEIMLELGFPRIYDCGTLKYALEI